ncbi:histidine kinase dimerization/phospho-acceptor domain-containing protein [Kiritimatiellota bacterium B12222]|nr:histidine kinase dimerization/phospho-acceptor domain-containing protein [Kiritimatiellota bacterium B12222]
MKSIQHHISWSIFAVISAYLLICGGLFLRYIHYKSLREFDLTLEAQMKAMISLVELEGRMIDIDFFTDIMPEFLQKGRYFNFYLPDGTLIAQSPSSQGIALPVLADDKAVSFQDWDSEKLGKVRVVQTKFEPRREHIEVLTEEEKAEEAALLPGNGSAIYEIEYVLPDDVEVEGLWLTAVVARDRQPLASQIQQLTFSFLLLGMVLLAGIFLLTRFLVRRGLKSLRELNLQIKKIEPTDAENKINLPFAPGELVEIEHALNMLLERVQATLIREKSFSTHVSHELRTPVAELKLIAEMGGKYPGDEQEVLRYFSEVQQISTRMEMLVNRLLILSRAEQGGGVDVCERFELGGFLSDCISGREFEELTCQWDEELEVVSDPALLKILLQNLLYNAANHRVPGSPFFCRMTQRNAEVCLQFENEVDVFTQSDLARISEPFWQKDPSRTSGEHFGLGLSIVRNLCMLLGVEVTYILPDEHHFLVELRFPKADEDRAE